MTRAKYQPKQLVRTPDGKLRVVIEIDEDAKDVYYLLNDGWWYAEGALLMEKTT